MIFVIRVFTGKEDITQDMIRRVVSGDACCEIFCPERVRQKKYRGEWHEVRERLIPGYLFVQTGDPLRMYEELRHVPALTRMLGIDDKDIIELPEQDVRWLKKALGVPEEPGKTADICSGVSDARKESLAGREVGLTLVEIGDDRTVTILDGPLKNMEGRILKYDLHKRQAEVEIEFLGRPLKLYMGIKIREKN